MDFLKGAKPVIRGQCDACSHARNVWVSEMGDEDIPCGHRNRGCPGFTRIVYRGPLSWMPAEFERGGCSCDAREQRSVEASSGAAPAPHAANENVAKLIDMGFTEGQARAALARCESIEAAVEWLATDGNASSAGGACGAAACGAASAGPAEAPLGADVGECAICCEQLLLADAAMRCAGQGGRRHHFHAHCLSSWVRQCRNSGSEATCPECRGPVQVRARRLQDFLLEKQSTLSPEDQEVMENLAAGKSSDDNGWSEVRKDLLKVGVIAGVGVGAALAVVGVVAGLSALSRNSRDQRERRQ